MQPLLSIQYLRAVAALMVVAYHAGVNKGVFVGVGAAGVDIFFVISGFIMWTVTERESSPREFLRLRAIRIVPLYWAVTLGVAALAVLAPALVRNYDPEPQRILLSLFFVPHPDPTGQIYPFITPGWTLNYEMFFYLVFAVALALPRQRQGLFLTLVLTALVIAGRLRPSDGPIWRTYTDPLLLEFLAGVMLAKAWRADRLPSAGVGALAILAGVGGFVALHVTGYYLEPLRALIWGLPAFLIVAGALTLEVRRGVPKLPWLKAVGDGSYSIYLCHTVLIAALAKVVGGLPTPAFVVVTLVVSTVGGVLCFKLFERPVTERLKRLTAPRRTAAVEA